MKHNKFSKFIEHILVCLPLLFLGITSAYVVLNPNAKDSLESKYLSATQQVTTASSLIDNEEYYASNIPNIDNDIEAYLMSFTFSWSETDLDIASVYGSQSGYNASYTYVGLSYNLYSVLSNGAYWRLWYFDLENVLQSTELRYSRLYTDSFTFTEKHYEGITQSISSTYLGVYRNYYKYDTDYTMLNNALPYAMGEFNKIGFGKIPFTSFFTSIFMNGETNVYVEFVNSYLNYFLFVEATYFLPMVIYWFIHFGERLIDKFSNKEF